MGVVTSRIARLARVWGDFGQTNFIIIFTSPSRWWTSSPPEGRRQLPPCSDCCSGSARFAAAAGFGSLAGSSRPSPRCNSTSDKHPFKAGVKMSEAYPEGSYHLDVLPLLFATPLVLLSRLSTNQIIPTEKPRSSSSSTSTTPHSCHHHCYNPLTCGCPGTAANFGPENVRYNLHCWNNYRKNPLQYWILCSTTWSSYM